MTTQFPVSESRAGSFPQFGAIFEPPRENVVRHAKASKSSMAGAELGAILKPPFGLPNLLILNGLKGIL
jgi:hypothetical protein